MINFDKDLYKQLKKVKDYSNIEDLCLSFTCYDGEKETNLVPNGKDKEVSKSNKLEYIY